MVNKGFPKFNVLDIIFATRTPENYNLPDFILVLIAKECKSELLERGRIDDRLQSMNDDALHLLHKVFVGCETDTAGKYAQYRFFAYVSSMYHKCEVLVNETIPGATGKDHKVLVAVKNNGMYISLAHNKATGNPVNKKETDRFYEMVDDIKKGDHGTMLTDAVYGSSVGFRKEALEDLTALSKSRDNDPENKLDFKIANFENNIYSVTKC